MLNFYDLLRESRKKNVSDIHLVSGETPIFRISGILERVGDIKIDNDFLKGLLLVLLSEDDFNLFVHKKELDFSFKDEDNLRYRANAHYERGNISIAIRVISNFIRSFEELNLPPILKEVLKNKNGLILVTGPCGSGKSTTLATLIEEINLNDSFNIITLEDPIEYLFLSKKSLIRQREIGKDALTFSTALRSVLRQDPDVIMVGELRDKESIEAALTAAETGHLVFATLHTNSACETITRLTNSFSPEMQNEIRVKLSNVLKCVVSQILVKSIDNKMVGAFEVMLSNPAISNHILNGKINQINTVIESGKKSGMILMKDFLTTLYQNKIISEKEYFENLSSGGKNW